MSEDGAMVLWDVRNEKQLRDFQPRASAVKSVGFSPDGKRALCGTDGGVTVLWDVATGRELARLIGFMDGEWVVITPEGKADTVDHPLYYIRDGIVIIPKNGVIPSGTVI